MQKLKLNATEQGVLGRLGFQVFSPCQVLAPWVQHYWLFKPKIIQPIVQHIYPDGGSTLLFNFNAYASTSMLNLRQTTAELKIHASFDCIGVRFKPGGAFGLFGVSVAEQINDGVVDFGALFNKDTHFFEQLYSTPQAASRLQQIESWLIKQARMHIPKRRAIKNLISLLQEPNLTVNQMSQKANLSRRQFERQFKFQVGIAPAQLKKLMRVKYARQLIAGNPERALTEISANLDFYDQAHFIRQFQQITGQTPGQYRLRKMSQKYNSTTL